LTVTFTWSVMSPSDFVKFRLVEFDQDSAVPVSELNPGGSWPVYVAALDPEGNAIASTTVTTEKPSGRPTDREAFAAARVGVSSIAGYVREQGFDVDDNPRITRAAVPDEYRA
jgi:hypothetical protein